MTNILEAKVLRYIVPFSYEGAGDYEKLYAGMSVSEVWKEDKLEETKEQDTYDYLLQQLRYSKQKTNIGTMWKYTVGESVKLAYLIDEQTYLPILVQDSGLCLFRSGVGFFWYELALNKQTFSKEEFVRFQNVLKELNKSTNLDILYKIENEAVRFPVTMEDFCPMDSPEGKTAVKCISKSGDMLLRKNALPPMPTGIEVALRYEVLGHEKWQVKYCGCSRFSLGDWIAGMLATLPCKVSFFASRRNCLKDVAGKSVVAMVPDKALLFNYIMMETPDEELTAEQGELLAQNAYYITSGYKDSYLFAEDYKQHMFHPFQNIYWYITKEGCGCYVMSTRKNAEFFRSGMKDKVKQDYFMLYLLMLHQSYTLLGYAQMIAYELPADDKEYLAEQAAYYETMENLTSKLNTFLVKGAYASVSHIQHQNGFYQYGIERLSIKEDVQSVSVGVEALAQIQRLKYEEQEASREKIEENNLTIGLGLLSLLAIFSALTDAYGFVDGLMTLFHWGNNQGMIVLFIFYALILVAGIIAIYRFIRACISQRKVKKQIKGKK